MTQDQETPKPLTLDEVEEGIEMVGGEEKASKIALQLHDTMQRVKVLEEGLETLRVKLPDSPGPLFEFVDNGEYVTTGGLNARIDALLNPKEGG